MLLHLPTSKRHLGVDWSSGRLWVSHYFTDVAASIDSHQVHCKQACRLCPGQLSLIYRPRIWRGWLWRRLDAMHASESQVHLSVSAGNGWSARTLVTQNPHPLTDHQKIGTGDYVCGPYGCAKFGANPSTGGFWANGWNITKMFFYLTIFIRPPYSRQTRTDRQTKYN